MNYQVAWGDETKVVTAETENDAWAKFAESSELATRHPKLHEREIVELEDVVLAEPVASPVANLTADEAKDHISRMRSVEKLEEIIASDSRVTVVEAAHKRLAEL